MLLPADAVPRETRRRTTLRGDRRRKKGKEIEFKGERWSGGGSGRGQVGSERDERSGIEGWRKWNGEKARHEARYFPHGERSLFTSPLSKSAPTGASEKKFRFSCAVTRALAHTLYFSCGYFSQPPSKRRIFLSVTSQNNNLKVRGNLHHFLKCSGFFSNQIRLIVRRNSPFVA